MDLVALAQHLAPKIGLTIGEDLFVDSMPDEVMAGVGLIAQDLAGAEVDFEIPGRFRQRFQAVIRHHDQVEGKALAERVLVALFLRGRLTLGDQRIDFIRPLHSPLSYPRGQSNLLEWSINFETAYSHDVFGAQ